MFINQTVPNFLYFTSYLAGFIFIFPQISKDILVNLNSILMWRLSHRSSCYGMYGNGYFKHSLELLE